jgi:hypothetical protein
MPELIQSRQRGATHDALRFAPCHPGVTREPTGIEQDQPQREAAHFAHRRIPEPSMLDMCILGDVNESEGVAELVQRSAIRIEAVIWSEHDVDLARDVDGDCLYPGRAGWERSREAQSAAGFRIESHLRDEPAHRQRPQRRWKRPIELREAHRRREIRRFCFADGDRRLPVQALAEAVAPRIRAASERAASGGLQRGEVGAGESPGGLEQCSPDRR